MATPSAPRQRGTPSVLHEPGLHHVTTPSGAPALTPRNQNTPTASNNSTTAPAGTADNNAHGLTLGGGTPTTPTVADLSKDDSQEVEVGQLLPVDMDACFKAFDKDEDGFLSENEFGALCRALFRNERGKPYPVDATMLNHIFTIFDTNKDHVIDKEEFRFCWQKWIKQVVRPVSALLVVDVQNDFISGSLSISNCPAGQHGEEVIDPINRLLDDVKFDLIVYTLDWHPADHVSFIENVSMRPFHESCKLTHEDARVNDTVIFDVKNDGVAMKQKLWPKHCVMDTWGAEFHEELKILEGSIQLYKGSNPDVDSYSAFWDNNKASHTNLNEELLKKNITDVYVCGIATDVCVSYTAKHALEEGYRTLLIDDCCRGVCDDDIKGTLDHVTSSNGMVIQSPQVKSLTTGRDRPPILAYRLALELAKKMKKK